jgi:multiple sugar transport system permease protein
MRGRVGRFGRAWRWALFALVALLFNLPILVTILTSFKTNAAINASPPVWIFEPTLAHYATVLGDRSLNFPRYMLNSVMIAGGGMVLALLLSIPAAYAMVRFQRGTATLLPVVVGLRAIPLVIFAIPFYLMYQWLGLLDTWLGMALIECIVNLPFALLFAVGMVRDLPVEVEEAARVDGAGTWRVLLRIVVPLARPMILSVAILSFIYSWNEFLFGMILTTRSATPVTVGVTLFTTSWGVRWGPTAAAMTLSMLPPLLLGLVCFRYLTRALTAGAVKG